MKVLSRLVGLRWRCLACPCVFEIEERDLARIETVASTRQEFIGCPECGQRVDLNWPALVVQR